MSVRFLFKLPVLFVLLSHCFASDDEFKDFTLTSTRGTFNFREVVLDHLEENDVKKLTALANDYSTSELMFCYLSSAVSTLTALFDYYSLYEFDLTKSRLAKEQNPYYQETYWIIEDQIDDLHFVGFLAISTTPTDIYQEIYCDLNAEPEDVLEISGCLMKNYRGQKVASSLSVLLLKKLATFDAFRGKCLHYWTEANNTDICALGEKFGFRDLGVIIRPRDFGIVDALPYFLQIDLLKRWQCIKYVRHFACRIGDV